MRLRVRGSMSYSMQPVQEADCNVVANLLYACSVRSKRLKSLPASGYKYAKPCLND